MGGRLNLDGGRSILMGGRVPPDPAPRGPYRGFAPPTDCLCPQTKIVPPQGGLYPDKINRLGASGAQIEVQISVFGGLTPDFVTFLG